MHFLKSVPAGTDEDYAQQVKDLSEMLMRRLNMAAMKGTSDSRHSFWFFSPLTPSSNSILSVISFHYFWGLCTPQTVL